MGNTFISHTKGSHCVSSIDVITVLSNTNHWNQLPNLLSGCVWQTVVTYHRFSDREDWGKCKWQIPNLIHPWNQILGFFFLQSVCHHWLVCVFINLIRSTTQLSRKNWQQWPWNRPSSSLPKKSPVKVNDVKRNSISVWFQFLPQQLNLLFYANEWHMYYRSLNSFHLLSLRCTLFSLWNR